MCRQLNLSVTLAYCYLSPWWNTTLPSALLGTLRARLHKLRLAGVSVMLNFGYENGKSNFLDDVEPKGFERIYGPSGPKTRGCFKKSVCASAATLFKRHMQVSGPL